MKQLEFLKQKASKLLNVLFAICAIRSLVLFLDWRNKIDLLVSYFNSPALAQDFSVWVASTAWVFTSQHKVDTGGNVGALRREFRLVYVSTVLELDLAWAPGAVLQHQ